MLGEISCGRLFCLPCECISNNEIRIYWRCVLARVPLDVCSNVCRLGVWFVGVVRVVVVVVVVVCRTPLLQPGYGCHCSSSIAGIFA